MKTEKDIYQEIKDNIERLDCILKNYSHGITQLTDISLNLDRVSDNIPEEMDTDIFEMLMDAVRSSKSTFSAHHDLLSDLYQVRMKLSNNFNELEEKILDSEKGK